ncbi:MAG TPA: DUF1971 domain-containing protein [Sphingopyxis sp.]|nr:DUF1971 domain-containing protein [Sphingopyxis sp.]HMP46701.1 DUF1971 domain-containing protein [Sphingopyxis sp.]HMQ19425.1 DUF1971 domain-containing protein [Sphingopyxis sp.]
MITDRGPPLPESASCYRRIGPFEADTIPAGLLRRHDLKSGVWGLLHIVAGAVRFRWDDAAGGSRLLVAGDTMLVPPTVPHHLETGGPVTLTIAFHAPEAAEAAA